MSTATSLNITHLPHSAYPIPLREQAFTLHCQGLRSPAISAELGVPERTIRAWIAAALNDLKDDIQLSRKEQLLLAVERQNQLTATAWQQFEREAAARDALLDAALESVLAAAHDASESASASCRPLHPLHLHIPASSPAPRYLSLIIQANKEINRLLGLYTLARLHLLDPDSPDDELSSLATCDIPAESATASDSPPTAECAHGFVGASAGRPRGGVGAERAQSAAARPGVRSAAESATGSSFHSNAIGTSRLAPCDDGETEPVGRAAAESAESATGGQPRIPPQRRDDTRGDTRMHNGVQPFTPRRRQSRRSSRRAVRARTGAHR